MPIDITSANSKLRIVVPAYYPGGFDVDDYAADNMFETGALQNKEDMMSADGKYHAGFIFNPTEFTSTSWRHRISGTVFFIPGLQHRRAAAFSSRVQLYSTSNQ